MHSVEEEVAVLDHRLVLPVLAVGPVRLDDAAHAVDLAVQPARGDEARQLSVGGKGRIGSVS